MRGGSREVVKVNNNSKGIVCMRGGSREVVHFNSQGKRTTNVVKAVPTIKPTASPLPKRTFVGGVNACIQGANEGILPGVAAGAIGGSVAGPGIVPGAIIGAATGAGAGCVSGVFKYNF